MASVRKKGSLRRRLLLPLLRLGDDERQVEHSGAGVLQGFPASAIRNAFPLLPEGYGFGLPVVYAVWLGAVALLYPLCRRWADLKARSRAWYLSYL